MKNIETTYIVVEVDECKSNKGSTKITDEEQSFFNKQMDRALGISQVTPSQETKKKHYEN